MNADTPCQYTESWFPILINRMRAWPSSSMYSKRRSYPAEMDRIPSREPTSL